MEKTRQDYIEDANNRIFKLLNEISSRIPEDHEWTDARKLINLELDKTATLSDEWYELAETEKTPKLAVLYFKVAQVVLVRNGLADGLPFCPLCGKIGSPEHNGAPLTDKNVCEACNNRKVIPARIRAAQEAK